MKKIYSFVSVLLIAIVITVSCKKKEEAPAAPTPAPVTPCTTPATPVITGDTLYAEGNTLYLITTAVAHASYQWTGPNGFSSTNDTAIIANFSLSNAGNYMLTVTKNGCTSLADTFHVDLGAPC